MYIDIGDESEVDLASALAASVQEPRDNGLSEDSVDKLRQLLMKYKQVLSKAAKILTSLS